MSGPDIGDTLVVIGNIHDNPELLEEEWRWTTWNCLAPGSKH